MTWQITFGIILERLFDSIDSWPRNNGNSLLWSKSISHWIHFKLTVENFRGSGCVWGRHFANRHGQQRREVDGQTWQAQVGQGRGCRFLRASCQGVPETRWLFVERSQIWMKERVVVTSFQASGWHLSQFDKIGQWSALGISWNPFVQNHVPCILGIWKMI